MARQKISTAERNRRYAEKHGVSLAEARRHGSGSHGKLTERPETFSGGVIYTTKSAQRVVAIVRQAARETAAARREFLRDSKTARKAGTKAPPAVHEKRIEIVVTTKDGVSRSLWVNRPKYTAFGFHKPAKGVTAKWLAGELGGSAKSARSKMADQSAEGEGSDGYDPYSGFEPDELDEFQVTVYDVPDYAQVA